MKIAMYKNAVDDEDIKIELVHKMKGAEDYIRITEVEDVNFKSSRHLIDIEAAFIEKRIERYSARLLELKTMLIEGYGDDE